MIFWVSASLGMLLLCICVTHTFLLPLTINRQPSIMMLRQAAQALSRRLPTTARRSSPSFLATSSSVGIDNFVLTPVNLQSKRDIWVWGSPPSSPSSNRRGFADAVVDHEVTHDSHWSQFPMAPPDPIIGLTEVRAFFVVDIKVYTANII